MDNAKLGSCYIYVADLVSSILIETACQEMWVKAFGALCGIVRALSLVVNNCATCLTHIDVIAIVFAVYKIPSLVSSEIVDDHRF